ncbi:MAG: class I SAM-dependent methyltransferase [Anaerolineae bacterium]|nr:class I SAM-dependent methyltransferase [Anaerolineae bacterium]
MSQPQAFDSAAPTYDADFTQSPIARYLRERVHLQLGQHFRAGDRVLELGCGTGEDALWLAAQGIHVLATDASETMLDITRAKVASYLQVQVEKLDLTVLPDPRTVSRDGRLLDGVLSNFGPLNVLDDWQPLAAWLARCVKPGGVVAFGVMGPLCLWEIGWHGLHGDWKTALRRLRGHAVFQPPGVSEPLAIFYPPIGRLKADFAPHFRCKHVASLGLFLPPSDVYGVIERRPRLLWGLTDLEERFGRSALLARFADHYWIEFERGA